LSAFFVMVVGMFCASSLLASGVCSLLGWVNAAGPTQPPVQSDDFTVTADGGFVWDPTIPNYAVWVSHDDTKTTLTFGMNERVFAQANVDTGEIRVLVTPSPTPVPRDRIERDVQRTEKTTLEQLRAEKADAERAIARAEAIIRRERKRLFRLNAEIATLDAALPSPTPSPTPGPTATPKGGR
jgi:hypothetical protein